jgi:cysteine-rich repeat protein
MKHLSLAAGLLGGCSLIFYPTSDNFREGRNCTDGVDNDGDGLTDGVDPECIVLCGDSILATDEACDDGNLIDGDGCSSACTIEVSPNCPDALDADRSLVGADGHCYAVFTAETPYKEAKRICEIRGGHLTTISSNEEAALLNQLAPVNTLSWIGAVQDRGNANTFFWTTYEPVTLDLFNAQPGAAEECVGLLNNSWLDIDCVDSFAATLCEFEAPILIPSANTGVDSFSLIVVDADANNTLDVASAALGSGVVSILENDGFGSLSSLQEFFLDEGTNSEIATDLDADGDQDLIVSNFFNLQTSLLRNIGNGTFAPEPLFLTQKNQTDLIFGDFNGDTLLDVALSTVKTSDGSNSGFIETFLRDSNSAISFSGGGIFSTDALSPFELVTSDFNGDSKADIAAVNHDSNTITILTGDGAGNFSFAVSLATCGSPFSLDLADADQDGLPDLVTACESGGVQVFFLESPMALFFSSVLLDITGTPQVARFGDINGDTTPDVIVSQIGAKTITVAFNQSGFFDPELIRVYQINGTPGETVIADFDQDGFNDVAVANSTKLSIDMLLNQGNGVLLAPQ